MQNILERLVKIAQRGAPIHWEYKKIREKNVLRKILLLSSWQKGTLTNAIFKTFSIQTK
jgi:hypothetical protein